MKRVRKVTSQDGVEVLWMFHCPGCGYGHAFRTAGPGPCWTFNGDDEKPSFTPSLMCNQNEPARRCHSYVTDGRIQFLDDCFHTLKGQTIELEDVDA